MSMTSTWPQTVFVTFTIGSSDFFILFFLIVPADEKPVETAKKNATFKSDVKVFLVFIFTLWKALGQFDLNLRIKPPFSAQKTKFPYLNLFPVSLGL